MSIRVDHVRHRVPFRVERLLKAAPAYGIALKVQRHHSGISLS